MPPEGQCGPYGSHMGAYVSVGTGPFEVPGSGDRQVTVRTQFPVDTGTACPAGGRIGIGTVRIVKNHETGKDQNRYDQCCDQNGLDRKTTLTTGVFFSSGTFAHNDTDIVGPYILLHKPNEPFRKRLIGTGTDGLEEKTVGIHNRLSLHYGNRHSVFPEITEHNCPDKLCSVIMPPVSEP